MELNLQFEEIRCCETTDRVIVTHEETLETVIPEYCPDVTRVIESTGQLKIREKKLSAGRLTVVGAVKVMVIYTSGDQAGVRSLSISIPFTCAAEDPRLVGCRTVCVCGRLPLVEARAVSARKLYLRVMPEFEVEGVSDPQKKLCCGCQSEETLQIRQEKLEEEVLAAVWEREFNIAQEFSPEAGTPMPEDLLMERVCLRPVQSQRMGSKLVIKGEVSVCALYRSENQDLGSVDTVLPFSQIIDVSDLPEDARIQPEVWVMDSDIRMLREEGRGRFGLSMRVGVMLKVYSRLCCSYIEDLFSTYRETKVEQREMEIPVCMPAKRISAEAVQQLELGQGNPFIWVTGVECGGVTISGEGDRTALRTNLRLKILYLDETGTPMTTERVIEAAAYTPEMPCAAWALCQPVEMQTMPGSCRLYIPVDFFFCCRKENRIRAIEAAEVGEMLPREMPSLVLRRIREEEKLWDIAKAYHTDPILVCHVNGLQDGEPLTDEMLLIPRIRE